MPAYKDEKSRKWFASFYYKDWDGQSRKKLKRGFETKKEAITYERNFTVKMSGSLNMLFEDYFELYKADVIGTIRLNTWMTKEHMIRTKILPFFSGMKMSEIKPVVVKKWHNVLLNIENAEGESYKPTYLKSIHAQLSCMFNHAVKYYGLRQNPCKVTGRIGKQRSDEEVEFWTKEEYLQFIEAVKDKDISFYAFEILYWTGIRLGELRALTKADFDFDKKTMRISKSAQRINGEEVITDPKTPKSKRTIMLPDFLVRELKDYFLKIEYFSEDEQIFPKCKTYFNDVTIAFRTNRKDRELISKKIVMSGLSRQDYMTNAILNAPIKVFATRNVIDSCKNELQEILLELKRVKQYGELDAGYRHELKMITEIIEAAIREKSL